MANIIYNSGNHDKLNSISITDGMIYFDTDTQSIYVDTATERVIFANFCINDINNNTLMNTSTYSPKYVNDVFIPSENNLKKASEISNIIGNLDNNPTVPISQQLFNIYQSTIKEVSFTTRQEVIRPEFSLANIYNFYATINKSEIPFTPKAFILFYYSTTDTYLQDVDKEYTKILVINDRDVKLINNTYDILYASTSSEALIQNFGMYKIFII